MTDAVVLMSGGMDSTTALAYALDLGLDVHGLTVRYGSSHQEHEVFAAQEVADYFGIERSVYELPNEIFKTEQSSLTGKREMPEMTYDEIIASEGPSPTVVPFRNANLLSVATSVAVTLGASQIWAGMHATDANNWAYPDCTPEFLGAFAACVYIGTYHQVQLKFPFIWLQKTDLIPLAAEYSAPLNVTWSCYQPVQYAQLVKQPADERYSYKQCGVCPTCVERIEAFRANGYQDPVPYAIEIDWEGGRAWKN